MCGGLAGKLPKNPSDCCRMLIDTKIDRHGMRFSNQEIVLLVTYYSQFRSEVAAMISPDSKYYVTEWPRLKEDNRLRQFSSDFAETHAKTIYQIHSLG